MNHRTGAELREMFLKYFEDRGHSRVAGSSLIPLGDETLLFTNAGMVQFKGVFTGREKRAYSRAVTAQKCLRVSGKHNDLENVGHTARHHTFFEMLGNFSFGDYFKEDAIAFGWEFLVDVVGLPRDKLYVTVYKDDDEAAQVWSKVAGFGPDEIVRLGEKDNFWSMGDIGPCGPCSEILIDQGEEVGCGKPDCAPGCDCDRYLELWNLVFMQYERDSNGTMTPLPRPSIDTGLGLERLTAVVQGERSNWGSDLFKPIIAFVEQLSSKECLGRSREAIAMRVIADHSRAAAFLISDGIFPSNEGRGYVLRRILRRASRYGMFIGLEEPFLYKTALVVVEHMSDAYPDLAANVKLIERYIRSEEERFLQTLARGLVLFEEEAQKVRAVGGTIFPGDAAFRLYDTYGFPPDLTEDLAGEQGLRMDQAAFNAEMQRQRNKAREAWAGMQGADAGVVREFLEQGVTSEFTGYETLEDFGAVLRIVKDDHAVDEAVTGDKIRIVTDRTPFYGESGGQVGDHGTICFNGSEIDVDDTVRASAELIIHSGVVRSGKFRVGDRVELRVDRDSRRSIAGNHSATHLLQWALRKVLGDHVKQSGSLVAPERLRFDFTHFSSMSEAEWDQVEELINGKIRENVKVAAAIISYDEARQKGATALFGEKYGDTVRMISVGDFSKELCGGTHVTRTGDIGFFKILSESAIAAGVRRIEAVTGKAALDYVRGLSREVRRLSEVLRVSPADLPARIEKLLEEKKAKEREIEKLKAGLVSGRAADILDGVREVSGIKVLSKKVDHVSSPKDLREYADRVRDRIGSGIALLGAENMGKVLLIAVVTKDLTGRFHAGNIVKKAAAIVGGTGGGRPDMAQAGGPDTANLAKALDSVYDGFG